MVEHEEEARTSDTSFTTRKISSSSVRTRMMQGERKNRCYEHHQQQQQLCVPWKRNCLC